MLRLLVVGWKHIEVKTLSLIGDLFQSHGDTLVCFDFHSKIADGMVERSRACGKSWLLPDLRTVGRAAEHEIGLHEITRCRAKAGID